jgi:hypothetical protein
VTVARELGPGDDELVTAVSRLFDPSAGPEDGAGI